jgi:hypothetical protein
VNSSFQAGLRQLPQKYQNLKVNGWIYPMIPADPTDRKGLITGQEYVFVKQKISEHLIF